MADASKSRKHTFLPRSSRVCEKIQDYYNRFGKDRELEKFMRLYSPADSQQSQHSHSPIHNSTSTSVSSCCVSEDGACSGVTLRRLFQESAQKFMIGTSKSLPNMEIQKNKLKTPIRLKGGSDHPMKESTSSDDVCTPKKNKAKCTKIDSLVKSHKWLEWDSMGDVGYIKAMSTSNVSVLERTLLKELFQESAAACASTSRACHTNSSEGDLCITNNQSADHRNHTPPLASSTFAERKTSKGTTEGGARPKYSTQGTSTSVQKQFGKYARTSMQRGEPASQAVQVNVCSAAGSFIGSSTTPSSFSYYSSHSNTTSNDGAATSCASSHLQRPHPFVANISQILSCRKVLSEHNHLRNKNDAATLQKLHDTLKQALSDNKENSDCSVESLLCSPQLDLGIQLLCSLIDAKNLKSNQKKHLVRDIVRRISQMSRNASSSQLVHPYSSVNSELSQATLSSARLTSAPINRSDREKMEVMAVLDRSAGRSQLQVRGVDKIDSNSESERILIKTVFDKTSQPETPKRTTAQRGTENRSVYQRFSTNVPEVALANNLAYSTESEPIYNKIQYEPDTSTASRTSISNTRVPTAKQCATHYCSMTLSSPSVGNTATSSSKEVTRQKAAPSYKNADSNTDLGSDQASMREWLNPMTHSEIEYEERKLTLAKKAVQKEVRKKETPYTERRVQLNWIEQEIQRLQSLRHLLLSESEKVEPNASGLGKGLNTDSHQTEKIYDTVCSTSSSGSTGDRRVQEIEVIIEESKEDVVDLKKKRKSSKERKRETQIYYDKPRKVDNHGSSPQAKARFRTMKETVITNEEQLLSENVIGQESNTSTIAPTQRSKMDTPSVGGSTDSESMRLFVQQRKREFLEQYKHKRKSNQEQQLLESQRVQSNSLSITGPGVELRDSGGYYSMPHTMSHCHGRDAHMQHHHFASKAAPPPPPPHLEASSQVSYTVSAGQMNLSDKQQKVQQNTSSSILAISSEISIPMGSDNSSSTPTTTHEYDDIALGIGVGVQTGDSMLRTQPISGPSWHMYHTGVIFSTTTTTTTGETASVQAKPKGIAYVIQFDKSSKSSVTTTTITNSGQNDDAADLTEYTTNGGGASNTKEHAPSLSLQDRLKCERPEFVAHSEKRKAILNQIQALRLERKRKIRDILENASVSSVDIHLGGLPPPPTQQLRIFGTKEMKALTNKHFARLPEVLEKQQRELEERSRRGNRVLRDVFNLRLQKRVRSGKLSLNHSRTVI